MIFVLSSRFYWEVRSSATKTSQAGAEIDTMAPSGRFESRRKTTPPAAATSRQPPLLDCILFRQLSAGLSP
jgi:hypothetical protein